MRALPLKNFAAFVAVTLLIATSSFADDKSLKLQVAEVATLFIEPLPMDKKYVLKSLSPDATGIPKDFLRKLTSDVEAGLLFASDNEMNLINRDATEEIWQEATEFNNAQFQELYAKSSADVMIMISSRLTADGVEISLTAYELSGEDVGKVLASSGTSVLAMDVKATLGVGVNSIDAKLNSVLEAIQDIKPKPKTEDEIVHENTELLNRVGQFFPKFIEDYGQPQYVISEILGRNGNFFIINNCFVEVDTQDERIYQVKLLPTNEPGLAPCKYMIDDNLSSDMATVSDISDSVEHIFIEYLGYTNSSGPFISLVRGGRAAEQYQNTEYIIADFAGWDCMSDKNCRTIADQLSAKHPQGGLVGSKGLDGVNITDAGFIALPDLSNSKIFGIARNK